MLEFVDSSGLDITKVIKEKTASAENGFGNGNVLLRKDEVAAPLRVTITLLPEPTLSSLPTSIPTPEIDNKVGNNNLP